MDANTAAIHCKNCHTLIQIPLPDPEIKKLPCQCGVTETARIVRYWATVVGIVAVMVGTSVMATCHTSHYAGVEQTKADAARTFAEAEKTKVMNDVDLRAIRSALEEERKQAARLSKGLEEEKGNTVRLVKELEEEKKKSTPLNKWLDKKEAEQAPKTPEAKKKEDADSDDP